MKKTVEWLIAIVSAIAIVLLIRTFIGTPYTVKGQSMFPTFHDKDRVIVSKISKSLNHLNRGDVIVFHENQHKDFIKRLIGRPGNTVVYKDDQLYVNGKKIKEPYLDSNKKYKIGDFLTEDFNVEDLKNAQGETKIPAHRYLVLGDNRQNSFDSRRPEVGLISEQQIVGKVTVRVWPFNRIQFGFNPDTFK
ncbi:signal peptidase I [Staphylococcus coagulans]|uniref:signal peptidase I n=1 Tax=Staphylococcus coagulans TaxID=74706 RepID=UPI001BEC84FA|nr:signal peptidase I [Staphylococcus coagulans]MBT2814485.1 signal peptidase I [Staphylococcus coagulans]MBT2816598.1 signal peptidase I [Staphylococcus coagulans]MBT2837236.1 signal peptidase I [Staphylococcus coagulans]MBT2841971.1 signal peptidase I [Staphylococcus coagulans]MBT2848504.1 signal peptidase I [Staphylococcus coagulans]